MLMDNTLELLGITDSNINTTSRFSSNSRHSTETQKVSRSIASKFCPSCSLSFVIVINASNLTETRSRLIDSNLYMVMLIFLSDRIFP